MKDRSAETDTTVAAQPSKLSGRKARRISSRSSSVMAYTRRFLLLALPA
jgi:hypothetical protein